MKMQGPFYSIPVKRVTERYLNRKFSNYKKKNETLKGFFDGEIIWICSDDPHVLLHEWFHAWIHQTSIYKPDEEAACDLFANVALDLFKVSSIEDLLK